MSGGNVELTSSDGTQFSAYVAKPEGAIKGALVVVQEIFGVNAHIRSVADRYADEGYLAVAPALFDRVERGVELDYSGEDMQRALELMKQLDIATALADTQTAIGFAAQQSNSKVGLVGFCYGGSIAWLAASRLTGLSAAVGYYGGMIPDYADEEPRIPVLLHFGKHDDHIPMEGVKAVASRYPDLDVLVYDAGHGFNCDVRASYDPDSARLANQRTLEFLGRHLA